VGEGGGEGGEGGGRGGYWVGALSFDGVMVSFPFGGGCGFVIPRLLRF